MLSDGVLALSFKPASYSLNLISPAPSIAIISKNDSTKVVWIQMYILEVRVCRMTTMTADSNTYQGWIWQRI